MLDCEFSRYIANGLVATAVHYGVLNLNIHLLGVGSYGLANFIAAFFGIAISFVGSRYFVYKNHVNSLGSQILRFGALYAGIAALHGCVLYLWSDIIGFSYHLGFIVATGLQVMLSLSLIHI